MKRSYNRRKISKFLHYLQWTKPKYLLNWVPQLNLLVTQSCLTLCDPMDWSPPGSSGHEISQARILEWVALSFFRGSSQPRDRTWVSYTIGRFFSNWVKGIPSLFYRPINKSYFQKSDNCQSMSNTWEKSIKNPPAFPLHEQTIFLKENVL